MIVITVLLIFLPYQGDNCSSSSKYSFKINKNKESQMGKKKKGAHFPNMEKKQLSESVTLRLIDLTKIQNQKRSPH